MFTNSTLRDYFNIQLGSGLLGNCTDTATPTVSTPVHNFVSSQQMDKNTYTRVYCHHFFQDPDDQGLIINKDPSNVVQNVKKNLYARLIIHPCTSLVFKTITLSEVFPYNCHYQSSAFSSA